MKTAIYVTLRDLISHQESSSSLACIDFALLPGGMRTLNFQVRQARSFKVKLDYFFHCRGFEAVGNPAVARAFSAPAKNIDNLLGSPNLPKMRERSSIT